jgi:hypothetical protein
MITKENIKKLREYLNSEDSLNNPKEIIEIINELCEIYEMKYGL